jgi:hypothetical protein
VFFGIRSYRDNVAGGSVSFGRALAIGMLIAAVSSVCYVLTWEVIYFKLAPDFMDKYAAYALEHARASGATEQALRETARQMKDLRAMLDQPLMNALMTFVEPFPVGVVVALVSAAVLRTKSGGVRDAELASGR